MDGFTASAGGRTAPPVRRGVRGATRVAALLPYALLIQACGEGSAPGASSAPAAWPDFEAVQPEVFAASGGQPNAWADFDLDGDLDLFVGMRGAADRLYRNDEGTFVDVAPDVGLADTTETRAAAWGDFDLDGDLDLYVGSPRLGGHPNRLYRNDDRGRRFTDVAAEVGLAVEGVTRQPAWVDVDGDGDLDLFVAFRDGPNRLWRNDGGRFTDITDASGLGDARRTVGAAWFDMDGDADLDVFVANQNGDADGLYRNDGGRFTDVAPEAGVARADRTDDLGGVGVAVADADGDGNLDVFVASYGPDALWLGDGAGSFRDGAAATPLAEAHHSVGAAWGDVDHDGRADLYVGVFLADEAEARDHLWRNTPAGFVEALPAALRARGASHGVAWADFDLDGDLDLALANNHARGSHPLYRNLLDGEAAARSLQIVVLDQEGRWVRAGATVVVEAEDGGWRTAAVMGQTGGYSSQGAVPVHVGVPPGVTPPLRVTVRWFEKGEARTASVSGVDPAAFRSQWLILRLGVS